MIRSILAALWARQASGAAWKYFDPALGADNCSEPALPLSCDYARWPAPSCAGEAPASTCVAPCPLCADRAQEILERSEAVASKLMAADPKAHAPPVSECRPYVQTSKHHRDYGQITLNFRAGGVLAWVATEAEGTETGDILEIGASSGVGSTRILSESLRWAIEEGLTAKGRRLHSLEFRPHLVALGRSMAAACGWPSDTRLASAVDAACMPTCSGTRPAAWLANERSGAAMHEVGVLGALCATRKFSVIFADGGAFTGDDEWRQIKAFCGHVKWIVLDDTHEKTPMILAEAHANPDRWEVVYEESLCDASTAPGRGGARRRLADEGNGTATGRRRLAVLTQRERARAKRTQKQGRAIRVNRGKASKKPPAPSAPKQMAKNRGKAAAADADGPRRTTYQCGGNTHNGKFNGINGATGGYHRQFALIRHKWAFGDHSPDVPPMSMPPPPPSKKAKMMPPRKRPPPPPVKDPVGAALPAAFSLAPAAPPPPEPAVSAEALGKLEAALAIPSHDVAKEVETLPAAAADDAAADEPAPEGVPRAALIPVFVALFFAGRAFELRRAR
ncbi:hypothetical protein AURANDRAFT_72084 [Aureococcus anophagefferens]|uniref:Uncharacterized protein n=1 Tax=Aureococcus anophagefferens TaxID=44056 RepID=F0YFV6_AURAN|nr:hypothetical protein AURANDRAFT_72084 [Aureococcus anophagefferens]EGB06040.1 hypothetical protein AURANDRAFT_72084 [Aureococcus anophagefferens]|eukprot:XP_009039295.1 hypothetical protein AURANDRAFT_72084 [Aureococcus anophagefferens]